MYLKVQNIVTRTLVSVEIANSRSKHGYYIGNNESARLW